MAQYVSKEKLAELNALSVEEMIKRLENRTAQLGEVYCLEDLLQKRFAGANYDKSKLIEIGQKYHATGVKKAVITALQNKNGANETDEEKNKINYFLHDMMHDPVGAVARTATDALQARLNNKVAT